MGYFDVVLNDQLKQRKELDKIMNVTNDRINMIKRLAVLQDNVEYDVDVLFAIINASLC